MSAKQRAPKLFKAAKAVRKGGKTAKRLHHRATRKSKPFKYHV